MPVLPSNVRHSPWIFTESPEHKRFCVVLTPHSCSLDKRTIGELLSSVLFSLQLDFGFSFLHREHIRKYLVHLTFCTILLCRQPDVGLGFVYMKFVVPASVTFA